MASRLVRLNPVTVNDALEGHVQLDLSVRTGSTSTATRPAGCRSVGRWCSSYGTAGSRCLHRRACSRSATHSAVRLPS